MSSWGFRLGIIDGEIRDEFFRGGERDSGTGPRQEWAGALGGGFSAHVELQAWCSEAHLEACGKYRVRGFLAITLPTVMGGLMSAPDEGEGPGARRSAGPEA